MKGFKLTGFSGKCQECNNTDSIEDKFPFSVLLCSGLSSILDSVHDHCLIVLVYNSQELNLLNFTDSTAGIRPL